MSSPKRRVDYRYAILRAHRELCEAALVTDWGEPGCDAILAVSPHLDDAVLSFGAAMAQAEPRERTTVLTVFAGAPGPDLSPAARRHHLRCGLGTNAVAIRRAEDRRALQELGVRALHGDLPDAIYRHRPDGRWLCVSDADIFAPPPDDPHLDLLILHAVLGAIEATAPSLLLGPAGIGNHMDHILTRRAVLQAAVARALPVLLWWDVPYAATLRADPQDGTIVRVPYTPSSLRVKVAAIECYKSQVGVLSPAGRDWRTDIAVLGTAEGRPAGETYQRASPISPTS